MSLQPSPLQASLAMGTSRNAHPLSAYVSCPCFLLLIDIQAANSTPTAVPNMSSLTQASTLGKLPTDNQMTLQVYTNTSLFQNSSSVGPPSHQSCIAFEGAGPNAQVMEQQGCIDPRLLHQNYHSYSSAQSATGSTSATLSQTPATPRSIAQPLGSPTPSQGNKLRCEICYKRFDRATRTENCRNRHLGHKPYRCQGRCGALRWYVLKKNRCNTVKTYSYQPCRVHLERAFYQAP